MSEVEAQQNGQTPSVVDQAAGLLAGVVAALQAHHHAAKEQGRAELLAEQQAEADQEELRLSRTLRAMFKRRGVRQVDPSDTAMPDVVPQALSTEGRANKVDVSSVQPAAEPAPAPRRGLFGRRGGQK